MLPSMEEVRTVSDSDQVPGMTELVTENESLKSELYMRAAVYDLETRLRQTGARSPNLLTEQGKALFEFSDEGELTNAEAVIGHLKRSYPEQFTPASIDASAGRKQRPTLTKEGLARMTPAEIQRLDWNEVRSALQEK